MEIQYRLEGINETEFKVNYEFDYSRFDPDKLQIHICHEITPFLDTEKIAIKAKASYIYDDEAETLLATNAVLMTFGLHPIADIIAIKEDGTFTSQNADIINGFIAAAMGVLRGLILKNLRGMPLEHYYHPLIPVESLSPKGK